MIRDNLNAMKLRLNLFTLLNVCLFTSFTTNTALASAQQSTQETRCAVSADVSNKIEANTFMIIPINAYASTIPEQNAHDFYTKNCALPNLPLSEKLNCEILKDCHGDACVRPYAQHGTAFLKGDGRTLVTAWHVPFQTHAAALTMLADRIAIMTTDEKTKIYQNLKPEFILVNHQNEIIYDTRRPESAQTRYRSFGDPLSSVFADRGNKNDRPFGYYENIQDELTVIDLQQSLGTGLQVASALDSGCVTSAGFGYDGYDLKFSIVSGKRSTLPTLNRALDVFMEFQLNPLPQTRAKIEKLSTKKILVLMGYSPEQADAQIKQFSEKQLRDAIQVILDTEERHARDLLVSQNARSLYFDAPVMSGFSGGPILNSIGEITGLTTNAFLKKADGQQDRQASVGGAGLILVGRKAATN